MSVNANANENANVSANVSVNTNANSSRRVTFAQFVESLMLLFLATMIAIVTFSGKYTLFTTPRAFVYLIIAIVMLTILALCAACGWFTISARDAFRMLVALAVPALLIIIPLQTMQENGSDGFDRYAGGRAIAISRSYKTLPGLNRNARNITVKNDDFGLWYDEIDHNFSTYKGYTITLTGFVSRDSTLGANQFRVSRQLMSCCILDMSPFGLVAEDFSVKKFTEHEWVSVHARIDRGSIGISGHERSGVVLRVISIREAQAPTGYFYRP